MAGVDTELLASVAELDPNIRNRVLRLANKALDRAEFLMEHGDPKMQALVIREYLKIFGKHLETKKANDEVELLRQSLNELREAVMARTPPSAIPATTGELTDVAMEAVIMDGPPVSPVRIYREPPTHR